MVISPAPKTNTNNQAGLAQREVQQTIQFEDGGATPTNLPQQGKEEEDLTGVWILLGLMAFFFVIACLITGYNPLHRLGFGCELSNVTFSNGGCI